MHKNLTISAIITLLSLAAFAPLATPTPAHASLAEGANVFGSFNLSIGKVFATPAHVLAPPDQVRLLSKYGYDGIVVTLGDAATLRQFLELPALRTGKFKLIANYLMLDLNKPVKRVEIDAIARELKSAKADLWVAFKGAVFPQNLRAWIGDLADIADAHGVTVVLYPHYGSALPTAEDAVRWMKAAGRDNIKVSIHLCHELKAGNGARLPQIIRETAPYLAGVTINGADRDVRGEGVEGNGYGYDRSIQTLGQGDFNVRDEFYRPLIHAGYKGPFVLHDFGIKDPSQHLARSMAAWKSLSKPAAEPASTAFDAPESAIWHEPSRSWFVSNLIAVQ